MFLLPGKEIETAKIAAPMKARACRGKRMIESHFRAATGEVAACRLEWRRALKVAPRRGLAQPVSAVAGVMRASGVRN